MRQSAETNDILYGELKMLQPREGRGPRVNVDTVLLADFVRLAPSSRAAEMGCAHGAISLIAARRRRVLFPDASPPAIDAFDINEALVDIARENAEMNGLSGDVRSFVADLRRVRELFSAETYDVVMMNPPYDDPRTARPPSDEAMAAATHGTECALVDVVAAAKFLLRNGGKFFCVMRASRASELFCLLTEHNVRPKRMRAVHPKPGRAASVVLVEAVRAAGEGLTIEPPLYICGEDGEHTSDLLAAYSIAPRQERAPCR